MQLTTNWQSISSAGLITNVSIALEGRYTSQSTTGNYTDTEFRIINYATNSAQWRTTSGTVNFTGAFTDSGSSATYPNYVSNGTVLLSISKRVYHNENGTKSFTLGGHVDAVLGGTKYNANPSQTEVVLPTIARYPIMTEAPNFNDEENPTIKFTTSVQSGITVDVYIQNADGSTSYVSRSNISYSSGTYTFTLTDNERNTLRSATPNSNTMTVRLTLRTLLNGNYYWSYLSRTLTIVNAKPTFSVAYQDTNATTLAITSNNQQIIQNQSTLQINISSASAKKGASLSSVSVNVNGTMTTDTISSSSKNINIGTINLSDNATIPITITDSRGNSTTNNLTITILPYELPSAIVYLARKQNYYTETNINVDATYSSLDGNNTLTIQYRTKKTSDVNYGSYATLTNNVTTTFNADNSYTWDVQVLLTDAIGSTTYDFSLNIGTPLFFIDKKKRSLGFLGLPQHQSSLEVNGGLYYKDFYGNMVNLSSTLTGVKFLGFSGRTNLTIYTDNGYGLVFIVSSYYVMMITLQNGTQTTNNVFGTPPTFTYTWDGTSSLSIIGFETWNHHIAIGSDHIRRIE